MNEASGRVWGKPKEESKKEYLFSYPPDPENHLRRVKTNKTKEDEKNRGKRRREEAGKGGSLFTKFLNFEEYEVLRHLGHTSLHFHLLFLLVPFLLILLLTFPPTPRPNLLFFSRGTRQAFTDPITISQVNRRSRFFVHGSRHII